MNTRKLCPFSFQIFGLLFALVFLTILSTNTSGQNGYDQNKVRTVYVISNANKKVEINRPRIIGVKDNSAIKTSRAAYDLEKTAFNLINQKNVLNLD